MAPIGAARRRAGQLIHRILPNASFPAAVLSSSAASSSAARLWPEARPQPWTQPPGPTSSPIAASFSTTPTLGKRRVRFRDNNPNRGVSPLYRSGPREPLSMSQVPLPRPRRIDIDKLAAEKVDPNHGLWEFFYDKKASNTPAESTEYGRAWTVEELRAKSWDDLHKLWWVCCKERNRIATAKHMRRHYAMGFGDSEANERDEVVRKTMKSIKHTLTERWYAWEDAVKLAEQDPEIELSGGEGAVYTPKDYLSDAEASDAGGSTGPTAGTTAYINPVSIPPKSDKEKSKDARV